MANSSLSLSSAPPPEDFFSSVLFHAADVKPLSSFCFFFLLRSLQRAKYGWGPLWRLFPGGQRFPFWDSREGLTFISQVFSFLLVSIQAVDFLTSSNLPVLPSHVRSSTPFSISFFPLPAGSRSLELVLLFPALPPFSYEFSRPPFFLPPLFPCQPLTFASFSLPREFS